MSADQSDALRERPVYGLVAAAHPLVHMYEGAISPLLPLLMVAFGVDYLRLGMVASAFSYAYALGALPAGILATRLGPRRLISLYLFGASLAAALTGLFSATFLLFGIFITLIGVFCGMYHPSGNTLISRSIRKQGAGFGIHGISGSLGTAVAPIAAAWLGTLLGWQAPYLVLAAIGAAVGVASLRIPEAAVIDRENTGSRPSGDSAGGRLAGLPMLILFFLGAGVLGIAYRGVIIFLPTYLGGQIAGLDTASRVALGGTVATAALLFGAAGQYIGGRLSDRLNPATLYSIAQFAGGLFILLMVAAAGIGGETMRAVLMVAAAAAMAFFYFATQPTQNVMVTRLLAHRHHGSGYGVMFFLNSAIGSAAAVLSGWLADNFGFNAVFLAMGGFMLLAGVFSLILIMAPGMRPAARPDRS